MSRLAHWGLVLVLSLHIPTSCFGVVATDSLSRGDALGGDQRLVSGNDKFALGFFQTGSKSSNNTVNTYLGIWFYRVSKFTPVWTANGANPTSTLSSPKLLIAGDGNLVVLAEDAAIWSTRPMSNVAADNDTIAVLSNQGNLVLRSSSNASNIFWQSFDYPTDTLLVGAKLGENKITGMLRRIVSRKNLLDQSPGVYSNELATDGVMRLYWQSSTVYWSSGKWDGGFFNSIPSMSGNSLCNHTLVNNDQEVYFTDTLFNESTILHVFLDVSGQWKIRIWDAHDWVTFTYLPQNGCDVYAVCGAFTTCYSGAKPICHCMKGFSVSTPEDWELEDRTGGCIRNTPLDCRRSEENRKRTTDKFYSMPVTRLPQNGRGVLNATSAQACAQACLSNCSCTAYSHAKGRCSIWHGELVNVVADDNGEMFNLRLAAKEVESNRTKMVIGLTVGISTAIIGLIFLIVIFGRRMWSSHAMENNDHGNIGIVAFRYVDIKYATKHFSEKLGEGGFGSVFKGHLSNSVAIAVKRLERPCQGEKQFRAEVGSIGIIHHLNLVKLIGFCCEGDRRILVYEHMANGSLDTHLFKSHDTVLDWKH